MIFIVYSYLKSVTFPDRGCIRVLIYIIGNHMNTAQSQRACEIMIAPSLSGKKRYARPQIKPATAAAIISMKLNFEIWTRLYINVVSMNPMVGVNLDERLFWMYPLQNISSAGPMIKSISRVSTIGFSPSFIP